MSVEDYTALPDVLEVRELRYKISRSGLRTRDVTLATKLLDAEVDTAMELAHLYGARWGHKTDLKHLKQTMKRDDLKSKRVEDAFKELTVYPMVYNLVRLMLAESARRQQVAADRIRFVDALGWLARLQGRRRVGLTEGELGSFRSCGTMCQQAAAEGISSDEEAAL